MAFEGISLKARNIKCFGEVPAGFDEIKPINIAIGRNSSGKSTLLDLVQFAVSNGGTTLPGHAGGEPQAVIERPFDDQMIQQLPDQSLQVAISNNATRTLNLRHWASQNCRGSRIAYCLSQNKWEAFDVIGHSSNSGEAPAYLRRVCGLLSGKFLNPFRGFRVRRIMADRDVVSEVPVDSSHISAKGRGLTNAIRRLLTRHDLDRDLVEVTYRDALNEILRPDADFSRIGIRDLADGTEGEKSNWEVYVDEPRKRPSIPLSQMGSGLKTIMLMLGDLLIGTHGKGTPISQYIFAFEELENNLHPAAQRRLFRYIRDYAVKHKCHFFITTHSNVVIDLFAKDDIAQIIHVSQRMSLV